MYKIAKSKEVKKAFAIGIFLTLISACALAQEDNQRLKEAAEIYSAFATATIYSKGAVQVSQLADEAQMKYSRMIISQNEEVIALLKQILFKPSQTSITTKAAGGK
jgi:hypothetical protein